MSAPVNSQTSLTDVSLSLQLQGIKEFIFEFRRLSLSKILNILIHELRNDKLFEKAWMTAVNDIAERLDLRYIPDDVFPLIAIACYTLKEPRICRNFNLACRENSWSYFNYKSLWSLIMMAFPSIPKDTHMQRTTLYRGVWNFSNESYFLNEQFTSASRDRDVALLFSRPSPEGALLIINGVPAEYARDVLVLSTESDQEEVLIWPLCYFKVTFCGYNALDDFYDTRCFRLDFVKCYSEAEDLLHTFPIDCRHWIDVLMTESDDQDGYCDDRYFNFGCYNYGYCNGGPSPRNYSHFRKNRFRPY